jgi:hypothetical protein
MVEQNWYAVLGITSSATESEIKRAFRKLAHIYHPDKNNNPIYFEQFKQIKKAYEVLGNIESKRLYDQSIQLEGRLMNTQPEIQNIQDLIRYFYLFEREMQQTDFRFINFDRIKWKLNYPLFLPLIKEMIQLGNKLEQQQLLKQILYVSSFLPYHELKAYQLKMEEYFLAEQQINTFYQLLKEKAIEAKWDQLKMPLVAFLSAIICLGIYLLAK